MTVTTYGAHAETAAHALNALIRDDMIPADEQAIDQMLHCRETVVDALRQRLYDVGQDSWYPPPDHLPARTPKPMLAGLDEKLASLVDNIAFALPTLPLDERRPHADYLAPASDDLTVEAWREAAIEVLSASHALSAAEEQPWRTDPGAGWWVMRDVAVALEAVLLLDARLDEVGLLAEHQRPEFAMGLAEKRMVLSQTARVATWHATSAIPEEATPRLPQVTRASTVVEPVSMVGTPSDLAAAQRRLARFLRPMIASDAFYAEEPEITADCARQVTASQLYLCRAFAEAAGRSGKTSMFAAFFTERAEVLESLQPQISHLADVRGDQEPNMRRFWQQSELTTAVARMEDRRAMRLQPTQMVELAKATHEVTHNLGKALRRELLRGNSNLIDAHPRHDSPVRVKRRSHLEATVTDLVNLPEPDQPVARFANPLQRAALQQTLNLTPTSSSRPPTPFPAARSATYGAARF